MNDKLPKYHAKAVWLQQAPLDSIIDLLEDYDKAQNQLEKIRILVEESPSETQPSLAPRESEAVAFAREGMTLEEIGARMGTSKNGAADSIQRAAGKMGISNKHEVPSYFLRKIRNVLQDCGTTNSVVFPINIPGYGIIGTRDQWQIFLQRLYIYPVKNDASPT